MKRPILFLLLFLIVGGVCSAAAAKWTLISQYKDTAVYLDIDSITSATLNDSEIKQFKVKMVSKRLNTYRLDLVDVKPDTGSWLIVHEDCYNDKEVLLETHDYSPDQPWNNNADLLWKPVLDKVLGRPQ